MKSQITRQALYALVWAQPTMLVAKELGMSDVGLAKTCRAANVPTPDRGYWAKKRAGKPVLQPRLPPRGLGQGDLVQVGSGYTPGGPSDSEVLDSPLPLPPSFDGTAEGLKAQIEAVTKKVVIMKTLKDCHRSIARLLADDDRRREKVTARPYATWHAPYFATRIEKRRLRLLNALFVWAARHDFGCDTYGKQARQAAIVVGDRVVTFSLDVVGSTLDNAHELGPPIPEDSPLELKILWRQPPAEVRLQWKDTPTAALEDQLTDIAREMVFAGEWAYRASAVSSYHQLIERRAKLEEAARARRAEEVRKEELRLEALLEERRQALWLEASEWRRAETLRTYVHAVLAVRPEDNAWANWALGEADAIDPLSTS